MPWQTPSLKQVRSLTRDYVLSQLGARAMIPNSVLRIMSDAKSALAHLALLYLDWLAKQLMPDTSETEWLDRHGNIWLTNADGSKGRKAATYANGSVTITGSAGIVVPSGAQMLGGNGVTYETTMETVIGSDDSTVAPITALTAGIIGNSLTGDVLSMATISGVDGAATVLTLDGGVDEENDDLLRERVLFRIQKPPMGGDADDYIAWATAVAGVTRAWSYPNEMGIGTITVRFMMDDLRGGALVITTDTVTGGGFPLPGDVAVVRAYVDSKRPVAIKDRFIEAPLPYFYNMTITGLTTDDPTTRARITAAIKAMEFRRAFPGQSMFRSWVDEAISGAIGEDHHELTFATVVMPGPGYMATLGTITYA
jgi:uncharacterized phage protein gp47/JayE